MEEIKINNNIKEDHVPLYNSEGKLVGIIKNELAFNDVRLQICRKKLEGYYFVYKGRIYQLPINGHVDPWPDNLYETHLNQLSEILLKCDEIYRNILSKL